MKQQYMRCTFRSITTSFFHPSRRIHKEAMSPSEQAMETFLSQAKELHEPSIYKPDPQVPDLPELGRMARALQKQGKPIINASAGDLGEVGIDLSLEFYKHVERIRTEVKDATGQLLFRRQLKYVPDVAPVIGVMKEAAGMKMETNHLHTPSGRLGLYCAFQGMKKHHKDMGRRGRKTLIAGPVVWSGYDPLGKELGFDMANTPITGGYGLRITADAIEETLQFLQKRDRSPLGITTILPDNPSGQGVETPELIKILELGARNKIPVLVDGLYSQLAPEGQAELFNMSQLEALPPEVQEYFCLLLGTTKCVSSRERFAALLYPKRGKVANDLFARGSKSHRALSAYNGMESAVLAYAISTFPGGAHKAMGELYTSIEGSRQDLKRIFDTHHTPAVIGKSFYGMSFLVNPNTGEPILRDGNGKPFKDSIAVAEHLKNKYGYFMAPGKLFRSGKTLIHGTRNSAALSSAAIQSIGNMMDDIYARV